MGMHAERIAAKYEVTREAQDAFALRSHQRATPRRRPASSTRRSCRSRCRARRATPSISADEGPRADTSAEALAKLKPAFQPDGGTVTAGNAPGITDGAAAVVIGSEEALDGAQPLARITGYAQADVAPEWLFAAPIAACGA